MKQISCRLSSLVDDTYNQADVILTSMPQWGMYTRILGKLEFTWDCVGLLVIRLGGGGA